jgi:hypothetical protein
MLRTVVALAAASVTAAAGSNPLSLTVNKDGSYAIAINAGWATLSSGVAPVGVLSNNAWVAMTAAVGSASSGADAWGTFSETPVTWTSASMGPMLLTKFKVYDDAPAIGFEQVALQAINPGGASRDNVSTIFPSFALNQPQLGVMQWQGAFADGGVNGSTFTSFSINGAITNGLRGGPFVLFDSVAQNALVFSPSSSFMSTNLAQFNGAINVGALGSVDVIPAGYSSSSMLWFGSNGINPTIMSWGAALLALYGKDAARVDTDYTATHLTYNTDHGTYY